MYTARDSHREKETCRGRERERERGSKLYIGMVYNNGALYFINVDVLTRRWPRLSMSRRSNFADVISRQVTLNPQVRFRALANFPAQILMFLIKSALRRVSKDFTRLGSSANLEHSTIINWKGKFLIKSFRSG